MTQYRPLEEPDAYTHHGDVRLAYFERGQGPSTLLLIMGIQMRAAHWGDHFVSALAERFRVVCFDNRGTGYSEKPVERIDAELWAGDALAVLDAVGVQRAAVIGFSMGGRIAQELMVRHPERVERAVLLSSAVGGPNAVQATSDKLALLAGGAPGRDPEVMRRDGIAALTGPGFAARDPQGLERVAALGATKRTPIAVLAKQVQVLSRHVCDELPQVRVPAMIVHGDADPLVPYGNGVELSRLLPSAPFVTLPGCGHLPMWEEPAALLGAILPFLEAGRSA